MAVDQVSGLPTVQQGEKGFEAAMGKILAVSIAERGSVSQNNIDAAMFFQLAAKLPDAKSHLPFAVLMGTGAVSGGAAKTQNTQVTNSDQFVFDAVTAFWGTLGIAAVMISVDIKQRCAAHCHQKRQVLRFQIAAGEH